jgi:hypothetical protein
MEPTMKKLPLSTSTIFELLTAAERSRYPTLDDCLTRALPKAHAEGLSPPPSTRVGWRKSACVATGRRGPSSLRSLQPMTGS